MNQPGLEAMQVSLQTLARDFTEMKQLQAEMARGLQALIRLDTEHAATAKALGRAFDALEKLETRHAALDAQVPERLTERLMRLEEERPVNNLASGWVMKAVVGIVVVVAAFIWGAALERQRTPITPATIQSSATPR